MDLDTSLMPISNDIPIYLCQNVICRLCGCTGNNNSFILLRDDHNLVQLIKRETKVLIKNDDVLPKTVCRMCIEKVKMIQHFISHCTRTQKVLYTMFNSKEDTQSIKFENDEQSDMVEEWLDEEYNEYKETQSEITKTNIMNDKSYGVLYTDTQTFKNIHVSVSQKDLNNVPVIPSKILGREKRERVKVVSNNITSEEVIVNGLNGKDVEKIDLHSISPDMYLQINKSSKNSPAVYRIITDENQKVINGNTNIVCRNDTDKNIESISSKQNNLINFKEYQCTKDSTRKISDECINEIVRKKRYIFPNI